MKHESIGLPYEVAVACDLVPGQPQGFWKRWKCRLQLRLFRRHAKLWPRVKSPPRPDDFGPTGEKIDFLAFSKISKELFLNEKGIAQAKAAGIEIAHFERVNDVMNQPIGEVSKFWHENWKNHPDKAYREGPPPAVFGNEHKKDQDEWTRLNALQKKMESSYQAHGLTPCKADEEGELKLCNVEGRYRIGREDKDQRRYWTGVVMNLFVPENSELAIWDGSDQWIAEAWLRRIKAGTVRVFDEEFHKLATANATYPVPELPAKPEQQPSEVKADQGQEGV